MKFLSITGPKADIDRMVNQYLSKYEIHLENALPRAENGGRAPAVHGDQITYKGASEQGK